jgi:hypothetical protein
MKGGIHLKMEVYIPIALIDVDIPDDVWKDAVKNFNNKLDKRECSSVKIADLFADVLRLEVVEKERIELVNLLLVVREDDIPKVGEMYFFLNGYLTFDQKTYQTDGMVVENISYDWRGKRCKIFEESS